jgi:hypothetical protein
MMKRRAFHHAKGAANDAAAHIVTTSDIFRFKF